MEGTPLLRLFFASTWLHSLRYAEVSVKMTDCAFPQYNIKSDRLLICHYPQTCMEI